MMAALMRAALLGSGTLTHVPAILSARCEAAGLAVRWFVPPYEQAEQQAFERGSRWAAFKPELTVVALDLGTLLGGAARAWTLRTPSARRAASRQAWQRLGAMIDAVLAKTSGPVLVHTLEHLDVSPLGVADRKDAFGWGALIDQVNRALLKRARTEGRLFALELDRLFGRAGSERAHDDRLRHLADLRLTPAAWEQLGDAYARHLLPIAGRVKKCVVLDLDQTLWGGVIGEDGPEGIALGGGAPGSAYAEFQQYLLGLFNRGMLLAVNSQNNPQDALRVIRRHPAMALRERHFAALKINWESKADNLRAIAKELNLGLSSLIYVDDDPAQRWLVRKQVPEVTVLELPADPTEYVRALARLPGLDALQLTAEDRRRGALYTAERRRKQVQGRTQDLERFLADLKITVTLRPVDRALIARAAQLTQRTNQFHAAGERWSEGDVAARLASRSQRLYAVAVADRFGDQGVSGLIGATVDGAVWRLGPVALSCRVLGRRVEHAVLAAIGRAAKAAGARELRCAYVRTPQNGPARRFLEETGFTPSAGGREWRMPIAALPPAPPAIRTKVG